MTGVLVGKKLKDNIRVWLVFVLGLIMSILGVYYLISVSPAVGVPLVFLGLLSTLISAGLVRKGAVKLEGIGSFEVEGVEPLIEREPLESPIEPVRQIWAPPDTIRRFQTRSGLNPGIEAELVAAVSARGGFAEEVGGKIYRFTTLSSGDTVVYRDVDVADPVTPIDGAPQKDGILVVDVIPEHTLELMDR